MKLKKQKTLNNWKRKIDEERKRDWQTMMWRIFLKKGKYLQRELNLKEDRR